MEDWEFLIQKENDLEWTAVELPILEIEEGNYAVAARTSQANLAVEIRLAYRRQETDIPYWSPTYFCHPNEGLIPVIPLTYLVPGLWKLRCSSDIFSELVGNLWQQHLQLQVLSKATTAAAPLAPSWLDNALDPKARLEPTVAQPAPDDIAVLEEWVQADADLGVPQSPVLEPEIWESYPVADDAYQLRLVLEQNTFIQQEGKPLLIFGRIDDETFSYPALRVQGMIRYQLRNPQTAKLLLVCQQYFSEQMLPLLFSYSLDLPGDWEAPLLLGEVILDATAQASDNDTIAVTASQSFTVTANIDKLLETVYSAQAEEVDRLSVLDLLPAIQKISDTARLNLFEPRKASCLGMQAQPSGRILPPKLNDDGHLLKHKAMRRPKLPKLPQTQVTDYSSLSKLGILAGSRIPLNSGLSSTSADKAFKALNLEERFWLRLNSLIAEANFSADDDEADCLGSRE